MLDTVTVMLKEKIMFLEKPDRIHFHTFDAGDDGTSQILDLMRLVIAEVDHSVEVSPGLQFVGGNTNVFCRFLPGEIVFSCDITQPLRMDGIENSLADGKQEVGCGQGDRTSTVSSSENHSYHGQLQVRHL